MDVPRVSMLRKAWAPIARKKMIASGCGAISAQRVTSLLLPALMDVWETPSIS